MNKELVTKRPFVHLKACPICGAMPEKHVESLGRPGGHGYPGCSLYWYKCEYCGRVKGAQIDSIYRTDEAAAYDAKTAWNEEVTTIETFLSEKVSIQSAQK